MRRLDGSLEPTVTPTHINQTTREREKERVMACLHDLRNSTVSYSANAAAFLIYAYIYDFQPKTWKAIGRRLHRKNLEMTCAEFVVVLQAVVQFDL